MESVLEICFSMPYISFYKQFCQRSSLMEDVDKAILHTKLTPLRVIGYNTSFHYIMHTGSPGVSCGFISVNIVHCVFATCRYYVISHDIITLIKF